MEGEDSRRSKVECIEVDVNRCVRVKPQEDKVDLSIATTTTTTTPIRLVPWRVFINHIDSYHVSQLTDLLLDHKYDASTFSVPPKLKKEKEEEEKIEVEDDKEDEEAREKEESDNNQEKEKSALRKSKTKEAVKPARKFELIGTVSNCKYSHQNVTIIPGPNENKTKFMEEILRCGFIIYDITQDKSQIAEASWVIDELSSILEKNKNQSRSEISIDNPETRRFILISSLLTWVQKHDTEEPLIEANYRKRRIQPISREFIMCERRLTTATRRLQPLLAGHVLGLAASYGGPQVELHYAFKLAWLVTDALPVVVVGDGGGGNFLPLIHIRDLATAVYTVMKEWPKLRYIVVAEPKITTQRNIIKTISKTLGTGKIKSISSSEALESYPKDITQDIIDLITANINVRPDYLSERSSTMVYTSSFCENIEAVVQEYKVARGLQPVRAIVLGPPASGKSMIARALAKHYQLPYLAVKRLIADTIQQLNNEVEEGENVKMYSEDESEGGEVDDKNNDDDVNNTEFMESSQRLLDDIRNCLDNNNGILDDDLLTKIFRRKLLSRECQNQGYIIDGYPKTFNQAKLLFDTNADDENEEYEESISMVASEKDLNLLLPDVVIALDASDEFLKERMISLPERELQKMHYTEENLFSKLKSYREKNNEDDSPLLLFDELEIHPVIVSIEEDDSPQMLLTFRYCQNVIGPECNYGLTPDEAKEEERRRKQLAAIEAIKLKREYFEIRCEREKRAQEWMELMERLKEEEEIRLCLMAEPLRHYLVKHVFPILTQGLSEVAKLRPDDPIDYLADYLFRTNSESHPLEPEHSATLDATLSSIQQLHTEGVLSANGQFEGDGISKLLTITRNDDGNSCRCTESIAAAGDSNVGSSRHDVAGDID